MENLRKIFGGVEHVEDWKDIEHYEGVYQVSSFGRIKSLSRISKSGNMLASRIMKPCVGHRGYLLIVLYKDDKKHTMTVHRIVAKAFVDNNHNNPCVNHIDEVKLNNYSWNLEWVTHRQNCNHSANKRAHSKYAGVSIERKTGKWIAKASVNNRQRYLGMHNTEIEAHGAYVKFCNENNLN